MNKKIIGKGEKKKDDSVSEDSSSLKRPEEIDIIFGRIFLYER